MENKLSAVYLIDDNEASNIYHENSIRKTNCTQNVSCFNSAEEAISTLRENSQANKKFPELILLDINMPGMNGWEFIEEYSAIKQKFEQNIVLFMLSTFPNPQDKIRAKESKYINDIISKPLNYDTLNKLLEKHFPNNFNNDE